MDLNMIEFYHDRGSLPDHFYYQLNGKSAEENYLEQKRKIHERIEMRRKLEECKRQIEDETFQAIMIALEQSAGKLESEVANDVVNSIQAAFAGGSIHPEALTNKTFSSEIAIALGKALGQAPFKLLDEIFKDE